MTEKLRIYVVKGGEYAGLKVKVKKIAPMVLSKVQGAGKLPERPTYEAVTKSGRVEVWPLDAEGADQLEGGKTRWDFYQEQLDNALAEQNDRIIMAMFSFGTECEVPDDGWEEMFEVIGTEVPKNANMRRAFFLATHLDADDIAALSKKIMEASGVSQEAIDKAEESFRNPVQDESEPG